jgi:ABC-type Mn2+/Zn2+ transport system permease subunit
METGEIIRTVLEEFPYALYGSILAGVICSFMGVYIVARRVVFFGAVLTQVSLLGLTMTFLPFFALPHTVGSLAVTLVSVLVLSRMLTGKKIPGDAVLGFVFISSIAARILILQKASRVEASEVESLLRGDILFLSPELFFWMLGAFVLAGAAHLLFFKEFSYVSFDPETARTQGFKAGTWNTAFYLLAGLVIAFATHMVGDLFVFAFLVVPPMAAMLMSRRVNVIFAISAIIGAVAPMVGLFLAFRFDFPASPAIVGVACAVAAGAWGTSIVRQR